MEFRIRGSSFKVSFVLSNTLQVLVSTISCQVAGRCCVCGVAFLILQAFGLLCVVAVRVPMLAPSKKHSGTFAVSRCKPNRAFLQCLRRRVFRSSGVCFNMFICRTRVLY